MQKSLLQLVTRSHKTAAAFVIRLKVNGGGGPSDKLYTQRKMIFLFHYPQEQKQNKCRKNAKINLALAAANGGNKARRVTLVVEGGETKTNKGADRPN